MRDKKDSKEVNSGAESERDRKVECLLFCTAQTGLTDSQDSGETSFTGQIKNISTLKFGLIPVLHMCTFNVSLTF